jgi:hypothetical protein
MTTSQLGKLSTLLVLSASFVILTGQTALYMPMAWLIFLVAVAIFLSSLKK